MEVMISLSCYTFKEKYTGKSALVLFCHMNPSDTCSNICYFIFLHLHKPPNAHLPAMQENRDMKDIENGYYLLCIFDSIMNTMTKANGKKVSNIDNGMLVGYLTLVVHMNFAHILCTLFLFISLIK